MQSVFEQVETREIEYVEPEAKVTDVDPEGFQKALKPIVVRVTNTKPTSIGTSFNTLIHEAEEVQNEVAQQDDVENRTYDGGTEESFPIQNA